MSGCRLQRGRDRSARRRHEHHNQILVVRMRISRSFSAGNSRKASHLPVTSPADAFANPALKDGRFDQAAEAYVKTLRLIPAPGGAMQHLERLIGKLYGNTQAVIRHLSALRRSNA